MAEGWRGPARSRGQHFLASQQVARQLVRGAQVVRSDLVVELGAGDGRLTHALALRAGRVIAVENDERLVRRLRNRFEAAPQVQIVGVDIEAFRWPREPFRVVANLPFGVTTFVLRELLTHPGLPLTALDLIVQDGAALKRTRRTGHALNMSWQPWWDLDVRRRLARDAFRPPPSVGAVVIAARRRDPPLLPSQDAETFAAFVASCFRRGQGRDASVAAWVRAFDARS